MADKTVETRLQTPRIALLGYGAFLLLGWNSVLIPSLIISIEETFDRSDADIGAVFLIGALFYAGGALGGGYLAERISPRNVLALAIAVLGTGLLIQSWAPGWVLFVLAVAIGRSGGGAIEGGVQGIFLALYPEQRGGALNLLHLFYGIGALLGPLLIGQVVAFGGEWRTIFVVSGLGYLLWAAAIVATPITSSHAIASPQTQAALPLSESERSLRPFIWLAVAMGLFEAAAMGVASWLVRFMSDDSTRIATVALSLFWAGVCLSRLASRWVALRYTPSTFTIACIFLFSTSLAAAALVPWWPLAVILFALTGLFLGPIYPMLMAIGGDLYPHRLSALSGGLSFAGTLGAIIYPPLMGLVSDSLGIRTGLIGAATLGLPTILAVKAARSSSLGMRRAPKSLEESPLSLGRAGGSQGGGA